MDVRVQKTHKHSYCPSPTHAALKAPSKFVSRKQLLKLRKTVERKERNKSRSFPSAIWSSTQSLFSKCSHVSGTVLCVRPQWRRQRTQPRRPPARTKCLTSVEKERWLGGTAENIHFQNLVYTLWGWEQSADQLHTHGAWKALFWRGLRKVGSGAPEGCCTSLTKLNGVPACRKGKGQRKSPQSSNVNCYGWELGMMSTCFDQEKSSI